MRLWKSWILAKKDLAVLRKRRSLMIGVFILPLVLGVGLPLLDNLVILRKVQAITTIESLLGAFGFFFMIIAALLPLYISSNSIIGEKVEKSLEPLLATPTTDGEILLGKDISGFIPVILSIYLGGLVYMILIDVFTGSKLGYLFYPNWTFAIVLFIGAPLACIYGVSFGVFVSAKVTSVQGSYQIGVLSISPLFILYVLSEAGVVNLNSSTNLLLVSAGLLVAVVVLYFLSKATFNREKILTQWK